MTHVSRELFAILVWTDVLLVAGVFLYLVSALRDAGGTRFDLTGEAETDGASRQTAGERESEPPEREEGTE